MHSVDQRQSDIKLSICITTYNRSDFIGATLESILPQLTSDCELVVLDSGSNNDTQTLMREFQLKFDRLRYVRQEQNNGFDRDCDCVVNLARGEYCWLMTDDDVLKQDAVMCVLEALRSDVSLIIVNVESRDFHLSEVLWPRWIDFDSDREYSAASMDSLFCDLTDVLNYVGCIIIKRSIWLSRERAKYYGSMFVFLGVIFQAPLPDKAVVMAQPLISYRCGNTHAWSPQRSELIFSTWPSLVQSFALSESARTKLVSLEPWKDYRRLLLFRGFGFYSLAEYRRWIRPRLQLAGERFVPILVAVLPGVLVNAVFVLYYSACRPRADRLQGMRASRFYFHNWRLLKRTK